MPLDLVIGGGFAGLATAVALAEKGRQVVVLERRSFLGGRAYSFPDRTTGDTIDNGQHLMMGCYHETLDFLGKIGAIEKLSFQKRTRVDFLDATHGHSKLECPALPAPIHLMVGLARLKSLSWTERLTALRVAAATKALNGDSHRLSETTVEEWLDDLGQSRRLQERFWGPMALATLNEAPCRASADMFARVLNDAFLGSSRDSQMVISKVGLSDLYTGDATSFIEARGGVIRTNAEVDQIEFSEGRVTGVTLRGGEGLEAQTVTSAVPPQALSRLIPEEVSSEWDAFRTLGLFKSSPIVSINLWYDSGVTDLEFTGLFDSRVDWVFNRNAISGKPGPRQHLVLVMSGAHEVSRLTREQLVELGDAEIRRFFPGSHQAKLVHSFVVREQEATISHTVGVARLRPPQRTPIKNFFLAGDWTDTGLPATIEGAVKSGYRCARAILDQPPEPLS